jgi:hypothetical protein
MARMSVLLPAPDGPERIADSPRASERFTPEMSAPPPGRARSTWSTVSAGVAPSVRRIPSRAAAWTRTRSSASSNPTSRWTTERHSAMSVYDDTMNESESCTCPNADAVCINAPSGISPRKKRGAATTKGKMIAAWP